MAARAPRRTGSAASGGRADPRLARALADVARTLRAALAEALAGEAEGGPLRGLFARFAAVAPGPADREAFADAGAQTIAYGLLIGRWMPEETGEFAAVPRSNCDMLEGTGTGATLAAARRLLGVVAPALAGAVEEALAGPLAGAVAAAAERVAALAGEVPAGDPVTSFFEPFLAAYDPGLRRRRGVFYTPRPVVDAIVAGVDELLRSEFGLVDGLAATDTWADVASREPGLALPADVATDAPFVAVLDFAAGTGTFLCACVAAIERTMKERWCRELAASAWTDPRVLARWRAYVPRFLLPRLRGFEVMPAPLVVARLQLAAALARSGYPTPGEARVCVELRDALAAPPSRRFTVIVGNPPYGPSASAPAWLVAAMGRWKAGLGETKSDLMREEWKFLRLAEWTCEQVPRAVVGVVINRDFLIGIAKRQLRASLQATFPLRRIVDLYGDVRGDEADASALAISQGVAIALLCRGPRAGHQVAEVRGGRAEKLALVQDRARLAALLRPLTPAPPYFRWCLSEGSCDEPAEYAGWWPLPRVFARYGSGIQSKNDRVCVAGEADEVLARVRLLARASEAEALPALALAGGGAWSLAAAQAELRALGPAPERVRRILYRPFDWRWTYLSEKSGGFLGRPRAGLMRHMDGAVPGLVFNRQIVGRTVSHFLVTRDPICHGTFYLGNRGQDFLAPLFLKEAGGRRSNFSDPFVAAVAAATGSEPEPETLLEYLYAVVHSPTYRARYRAPLRLDFARVPIPAAAALLVALAELGRALIGLHLLETVRVDPGLAVWTGAASPVIEEVSWSEGTVWIDRGQRCGFAAVPEEVWRVEVGGYAPCAKWLKDRRGARLDPAAVEHYRRVVAALRGTIEIVARIDAVIADHGGWPGAFVTPRPG